jgi:hypothetical protein
MGSVFEARHRRTGKRAAVKLLLPRLGKDAEFAFRFLREARALARISHPNVVHAYDAGRDGEFYFIAMELVDGQDLQRCLEKDGCLSPLRSAEVALATARALEAISEAGLVHRDVKPANILIDSGGAVKLADLGLFHDDLDPAGDGLVFFGTPQYMSPEQVLGKADIDSRSDLYSLGATWYHALLGRPLFSGEPLAVARAQVEAHPTPPREIRPDVPLALDALILKLLAKERGERFSGPGEAARAIEQALAALAHRGQPAAEVPRPEAAGRWPGWRLRGFRRLAAAFVLLFLVAALAAFFTRGTGRVGTSVPSPGHPAATGPEAAPALVEGLGSLRLILTASADRAGRALLRAFDRAVPRSWTRPREESAVVAAGPGQAAPREGHPSGSALLLAPAASSRAEVEAWAAGAALLATARLGRVVASFPEGLELPVVLRDGTAAVVRAAAGAGGPLRTAAGGEIHLAALHPVVVIAWAGNDPGEPLPDEGVGLAVAEGLLPLARSIAKALLPSLPPAVEALLAEPDRKAETRGDEAREPGGSAETFLARALRDLVAERSARVALAAGRYGDAVAALDSLLLSEEPPALAALSRIRWDASRRRAARLDITSSRLFARPASAVDPLRGEALTISYPFDGKAELSDFRLDGTAWTVEKGALVRQPGRPEKQLSGKAAVLADPADTVALFALPVVVEGEWSGPPRSGAGRASGARLAVGFGGWFVGLCGPAGPIAWRGEPKDGPFPPEEGPGEGEAGAGGRFRIEFREGAAAVRLGEGAAVELTLPPDPAPGVPAPGRLALSLSPGSRLLGLSIIGTPDPVWAGERIAALGGGR